MSDGEGFFFCFDPVSPFFHRASGDKILTYRISKLDEEERTQFYLGMGEREDIFRDVYESIRETGYLPLMSRLGKKDKE